MSAALHRLPVDPDLDIALRELVGVAVRLRQAEEMLIADGTRDYVRYGHLIAQRDECRASIKSRAERLSIRPGSLRLFIEESERLRRINGRRPSLAQLQRAVIAATEERKRYLLEREADEAVAAFRAKHADTALADAEAGTAYLQACQ